MKQQLRHVQYKNFRKVAKKAGFARFRQADIRTRVTIDTDGTQEAAAGVAWTAEFFGDTSDVLSIRTKEPKIKADTPIGNEFLICARSLSVTVVQGLTTLTTAERNELMAKLSRCVLTIKAGTDIIFEREIGYLLGGTAGLEARSDGEGTNAIQVGKVNTQEEGDDFDDALIVFPGASIQATIHGDGQWMTTDDVIVQLCLHGWVALKGAVEAGVKVLGLMDLVEDAQGEGKGLLGGAIRMKGAA